MSTPTKTKYNKAAFIAQNVAIQRKQQQRYQSVIQRLKATPCHHCDGKGFLGIREHVGSALMIAIEKATGLSWDLITSKSQARPFCNARSIVAAYLRSHESASYPTISRVLGRRDHTTAINMLATHSALVETEAMYRDNYTYFVELIQQEIPKH